MNNYNDIILKYNSLEMTLAEREEFKRNLKQNEPLREEFEFQKKLDRIMKQSLLLEAIENDPFLKEADILAQKDVETYMNNRRLKNAKKEITSYEVDKEIDLQIKVSKAEVEMLLSGIDDIAENWVKDFDRGKANIGDDVAAKQIVEYVKRSDPFHESEIHVPKLRRLITRKIAFQAAAAVLVLSMLLFKTLIPSYSGNSVFERFYEPLDANSYRLRGNSNEVSGKLQEGVDYYLSKDYRHAEKAFNELRNMNENLQEVLLFSGLNHMGQGNFTEAITLLTDLLSADDQFIPEAQWYLGLCYIKTGEIEKARPLMETLSKSEGLYQLKAQQILKNLNK
jgi:TolA-binding protein